MKTDGASGPGLVLFTGNKERLVRFYEAVTGLAVRFTDESVTVLGSDSFELVIHALAGEGDVGPSPRARDDSYIKPFFRTRSLAEARNRAEQLGGRLSPRSEEWEARGFRACEAVDPDGNVIQFREAASQEAGASR